jgi:hypothetical protein
MGGGAVMQRGELADVEIARPRLVVGVVDEQRVGNRGRLDRAGQKAAKRETRRGKRMAGRRLELLQLTV